MFHHWLGDYHPVADETDGKTFFWLGDEGIEVEEIPVLGRIEADGFITYHPILKQPTR